MENMFGNIGGDMFNPKIMDAKQAEINKAKFAEEDKKKADEEAKKKTEAGAKGNEPGKQPAQPKQEEHTATMNDLNDQLKKLNTMMMTLVNNSTQMTTISDKISKNTKQGRF
jgi:membrane protein involved in colicin uptake